MRLRKLDLIRYGKFADTTLDFGAADRDCDVTIVYGDNEAGKSTAFAAWLDLLFGLPSPTPHSFRFPRKDMMIGAVIETGTDTLTLRRTGVQKDSLSDDQGRAVAEHRLTALLHGLDRDAYQNRFSLNDAILRQGGEEIARAQGDLGQLLHAGTSGLSGISKALDDLDDEVATFHQKRKSTSRLAIAKRDLKEIETNLSSARVDPRRFDALRADQDSAQEALIAARATLLSAQGAVQLRKAADLGRSLAADIAAVQTRLDSVLDGPDLPVDAVALIVAATERRSAASRDLTRQQDRLTQAETALSNLTPDPDGLTLGTLLAELETATFDDGELLLPRVQTATADIARRRNDHDTYSRTLQALADKISAGSAPNTLLLDRAVLDNLRTAAGGMRDAQRSVADLHAALSEAQAALGPEIAAPNGLPELADALLACQRDTTDPTMLARTARSARLTADRAASGLPQSWRETLPAGLPAGLPDDAVLLNTGRALDLAEARQDAARQNLSETQESLADANAARAAAEAQDSAVTDGAIHQSRINRDTAWARHLPVLDTDSATTFEVAMRQDDTLRDRHAATAEGRLQLATLEAQCQQIKAKVDRRANDLTTAQNIVATARDHVDDVARQLGLPDNSPTGALRPRRAALVAALDAALLADAAEDAARQGTAMRATLLQRLETAVQNTGTPLPDHPDHPGHLLDLAERRHKHLTQQAQQAEARTKSAQGLDQLAHRMSAAQTTATQAQTALDAALIGLWCAGWDADRVLAHLPDLDTLAEQHRARAVLAHRIDALEAALAAFEGSASQMRQILEVGADTPPAALLVAARTRAAKARSVADALATHRNTRTDATTHITDATRTIQDCDDEMAEVLANQILPRDATPAVAVRQLEARDRDRATLRGLTSAQQRAGDGLDADALLAEAAITDPLRAPALSAAVTEAEVARDTALERVGQATEALRLALNATGGADLEQQRATLLETLRDDAQQAFARLMGVQAARGALRRFRQDNRGAMLAATEAAFATLTHGEWQSLETRSMGKTEKLVAMRGGEAVGADAMSTGTRGQLYLALRVAGHADFVARNGPLPFVTDDIHETFDDRRASAALDLAAQMGRLGQTILFTHHQHLVALAQDRIDGVRVLSVS